MKLTKDKVIKEIPANLASLYVAMGWKEVKEEKPKNNSFSKPFAEKEDTKNKEF